MFLDMLTSRISTTSTRQDIERVFKLFDSENTGEITAKDMMRVCKELGDEMSEKDVQEIIQRADLDNDSKLTVEDFYAVLTKKSF